jgi:hypothetical protein
MNKKKLSLLLVLYILGQAVQAQESERKTMDDRYASYNRDHGGNPVFMTGFWVSDKPEDEFSETWMFDTEHRSYGFRRWKNEDGAVQYDLIDLIPAYKHSKLRWRTMNQKDTTTKIAEGTWENKQHHRMDAKFKFENQQVNWSYDSPTDDALNLHLTKVVDDKPVIDRVIHLHKVK